MPGPANPKKKRKAKKKAAAGQRTQRPPTPPASHASPTPPSTPSPIQLLTPPPSDTCSGECCTASYQQYDLEPLVPEKPFIYDPGNGPRVRDTKAFLASKFFAQPPAWSIPLCAEFAQEEVLEMIRVVLPEELALILWYNKSRATSRICPACQRLYRLGDVLPAHMSIELDESRHADPPDPRLRREQEISGLCSPVCFILSAFNYPGAIQSAWGRMGDEMGEEPWYLLNGPGDGTTHSDLSQGLGMLVKMTRLYDLGLAQLCFSDEEWNDADAPNTN